MMNKKKVTFILYSFYININAKNKEQPYKKRKYVYKQLIIINYEKKKIFSIYLPLIYLS